MHLLHPPTGLARDTFPSFPDGGMRDTFTTRKELHNSRMDPTALRAAAHPSVVQKNSPMEPRETSLARAAIMIRATRSAAVLGALIALASCSDSERPSVG